jgi:hypothetical protein
MAALTFVVSRESIMSYGLNATPEIIVVSPEGIVRRVWKGTLTGRNHDEVERFFDARIPESPQVQ